MLAFAPLTQARVSSLVSGRCHCADGGCWSQYKCGEVVEFLNQFEARSKREQDAILFLAVDGELGKGSRKEFSFLERPMRRTCFQTLLGIGSHRIDKLGSLDLRFGKRPSKPSQLTASVDSFCIILYNSIAEPLPTKPLVSNHFKQ